MTDGESGACYCPCNRSPNRREEDKRPISPKPPLTPELNDYPHHWSKPTVKQLYCRTGYNLAIDKTGRVFGAPEAYNNLAIMEFKSIGPGEVQMKGLESGFYLAMNKEGKLYGQRDSKEEGTIFVETYDRNSGYNNYLSRKYAHHGWYVGIKKSGRFKPGPKTAYGQKAIMFLPRQPKPSGM